jgi:general secretion pathway protein L
MIQGTAVGAALSAWTDATAEVMLSWSDRLRSRTVVKLVERGRGELEIVTPSGAPNAVIHVDRGTQPAPIALNISRTLKDARVEVALLPDQFLFRRLELPNRAAEFLPGIVRAQIDSLTPWRADECVFGWSSPQQVDSAKMAVTVVATARDVVAPYISLLARAGCHAISLFTMPAELSHDAIPVNVHEELGTAIVSHESVSRMLRAGLALSLAAAVLAVGGAAFLSDHYAAQQRELSAELSRGRAHSSNDASAIVTAQDRILSHKHDSPFVVLVLEDLSRLLPDHTYLTEMRIEGSKLQIVGTTREAPALVGLLERSGRFKQVSFFAPTTRALDQRDRFHIEATIQPVQPFRS